MLTIWKYPIAVTDQQWIEMPRGAAILHAGLDPRGELYLWALVNPDNELVGVEVNVIGTGNECDVERDRYLSTVLQPPFVWHVFVEIS